MHIYSNDKRFDQIQPGEVFKDLEYFNGLDPKNDVDLEIALTRSETLFLKLKTEEGDPLNCVDLITGETEHMNPDHMVIWLPNAGINEF